jgi:hypothetical protein
VTARHVVEGQVSCRIELDPYRLLRLGGEGVNDTLRKDLSSIEIEAHPHPDAAADVAVFSVPVVADLSAIPLGGHLDDWIPIMTLFSMKFSSSDLLRFLSRIAPVLVAARGQINAVVDLINVKHVGRIGPALTLNCGHRPRRGTPSTLCTQ